MGQKKTDSSSRKIIFSFRRLLLLAISPVVVFACLAAIYLPDWPFPAKKDFRDRPHVKSAMKFYRQELWPLRRPDFYEIKNTADDIRDILVSGSSVWCATGKGLVRFAFDKNDLKEKKRYTAADGLLSDNVFKIREDAEGGIWVWCLQGVACLQKNGRRWQSFSEDNGLPSDRTRDIALSSDGRKVFVSTIAGLAVYDISKGNWQTFKNFDLLEIFVQPSGDFVWCRKVVPWGCSCGCKILITQLDLKTGNWLDFTDTKICPHVSYTPVWYSRKNKLLCCLNCQGRPIFCDPALGKVYKSGVVPGGIVPDDCHAGDMGGFGFFATVAKGKANIWLGSNAALWRKSSDSEKWEKHYSLNKNLFLWAQNALSSDGRRIYSGFLKNITVLDIENENRDVLWSAESEYRKRNKGSIDDAIYEYKVAEATWSTLFGAEQHARKDMNKKLLLSPDEKFLWWLGANGILVGNLESRELKMLSDKDVKGLTNARFVRFVPEYNMALIATPNGLVCADYSGILSLRVLSSSSH